MDDPAEELEPLFDYTRVQPAEFFYFDDQDLETSPIFTHCKRTNLSNDRGKEKVRCEDVVVLKEDEGAKKGNEEEDWLPPPPPKAPSSGLDFEKDETLRELRLKKQELASLARSAQDVLKDLVETAERELKSSRVPAEEVILDSPEKPQAERQKIVISIQGKDDQKQFRVYSPVYCLNFVGSAIGAIIRCWKNSGLCIKSLHQLPAAKRIRAICFRSSSARQKYRLANFHNLCDLCYLLPVGRQFREALQIVRQEGRAQARRFGILLRRG